MRKLLLLGLVAILTIGCASARSTLVQRSESDECWQTERCLNGVPITVQVPTHIRVDITEHRYLGLIDAAVDDNGKLLPNTGTVNWIDPHSIQAVERTVNTRLVKTAKIFTVDPRRPAAGTIDSTLTFGGANGQYLDQIDYDVKDETISAITKLLSQVAPSGLFGAPTSEVDKTPGESIDQFIQRVDNVVASAMFNLDAPDVELQIAEFLEVHLNGCHRCNATGNLLSYPPDIAPQQNTN